MPRAKKILFFSMGSSARSQIAEGYFRAWSQSDVEPVSTAVQDGEISAAATEVMREVGIDISHQRARTIKDSFQEYFVCVIAICEIAHERCPVWPFARRVIQWDIPDPERQGLVKVDALRAARDQIAAKVKDLLQETVPKLQTAAAGRR